MKWNKDSVIFKHNNKHFNKLLNANNK
eukprot:SAG22_NODE_6758_length_814_cov_43.615385_1_plen_26_part_10